MLRRMSGRQLLEWEAYADVEPFGEERADLRLASIQRMLFSINRDIKTTPTLPSIGDFYASFVAEVTEFLQPSEEREKKKKIAKTQTWQQQKEIFLRFAADAAARHNAEQAKAAKKKRVKQS